MRENRKRYVRFRLHREGPSVERDDVTKAIRGVLLSLYGEVCVADSKFYLTDYDPVEGLGTLECSLRTLEYVLIAASLMTTIGDTIVAFQPLKTSGTLKALMRKS